MDQETTGGPAAPSGKRPLFSGRYDMSKDGKTAAHRIDQFLLGPGGRADDWRDLVEAAKAWAGGSGDRGKYEALLNHLAVTEEFHGYPGLQLMAALKESAAAGDAS